MLFQQVAAWRILLVSLTPSWKHSGLNSGTCLTSNFSCLGLNNLCLKKKNEIDSTKNRNSTYFSWWAIHSLPYHPKKNPLNHSIKRVFFRFLCTQGGNRTRTSLRDTGFWVQRVYQFRHLGVNSGAKVGVFSQTPNKMTFFLQENMKLFTWIIRIPSNHKKINEYSRGNNPVPPMALQFSFITSIIEKKGKRRGEIITPELL